MRLLLLEDNARLGQLTCDHLRSSGYIVDLACSIVDFRAISSHADHALYIVDLTLPDGDALDVIRELRTNRRCVPVLVTSARSEVSQRIAGLDAGADDYLTKPFNCDELIARVRALLRRPLDLEQRKVMVGQLELDTSSGEIFIDGSSFDLCPSERRLLALLIRRNGHIVTKSLIETMLYEYAGSPSPNAIEKLVSRLRSRIGTNTGIVVKTVYGDGYRLEEVRCGDLPATVN